MPAATGFLVEVVNSKPVFAALALVTHSVLHSAEWDLCAHLIVASWILFFGSCTAVEYFLDPQAKSFGEAYRFTRPTAYVYFGVLTISILIHRGFFHRLKHIPGPYLARFTKWHAVTAGVFGTRFQLYWWVEGLHKKYDADVVRTGPREVAIYAADAIPVIHGPMTRCRKGLWYQGTSHIEGDSILTTRSKEVHRNKRQRWDRAFSTKALREYEPRLDRFALLLLTKLKEIAEKPSVRITDWLNFYSFDVMSDIGFNTSFGMLEKGKEDPVIGLMHESMSAISIFGQVSWMFCLLTRTRTGARPMLEHMAWTNEVVKERVKMTPAENDVVSWLLDPEKPEFTKTLGADARILVVAGSDTTSATLSWLCYELCKHQDVQAKLRKAVDQIQPGKSHLEVQDVGNCEYLNGTINEALRLHPAVPSGVQRETPPEGLTLPNGTYIPGNIHIWMPIHTIQRDPRYFKSPLEFMPERWTSEQPDAVIDKRAFMPFSHGTYNCVGQKLAMIEMRTVLGNLIRSFEMQFAEGETGKSIEGSVDCFVTNIGKLDVKLTPRYKA